MCWRSSHLVARRCDVAALDSRARAMSALLERMRHYVFAGFARGAAEISPGGCLPVTCP